MRLATLLVMSIALLTSCSESIDQSKKQNEQLQRDEPEEKIEEVEEISNEQKLLEALPSEANLEDWNLILVNPWEALPKNYEPQLVTVDNQQQIDQRIVEAWSAWKEAAEEAGHQLFFASGYRTIERQRNNFNNRVQGYLNEGLSEEEATEKAKEYLTEPGHSEHHTGLALDIVDGEWINAGYGLVPEYDTQASQQWLVDTMDDYGFILRYPEGKEEITGIQYESWHFRYVGEENAQYIVENDLVLEEYIERLQQREDAEMEY